MREESGNGVERWRRTTSQVGLALAIALLVVDLVAIIAGSAAIAWSMPASLAVLVAMPLINLVAAVIEEWKRREWTYVAAAGVVVALLVYAIA